MRERIASAALVALVHAGLLFLLLSGGPRVARPASETALSTFDVAPPPPPPPPSRDERVRSPARAPRVAGAAGRQARRAPVVAPMPPVAPRPPPPVAAVLPDEGAAPLAGTAASGGGTGAAIGGWGHGAGGSGDGGRRARLLSGRIEDRDYPAEARRTRAEGIATVRFTVDTDGHARRCRVQRSAGDAALDAATCRLIEERFRYAPAQDAAGRAVAEERAWQQRWWLER